MDMEELTTELKKMDRQQQQWRDDHDQRDKHWFWQKGFWLFMAGATSVTLMFKIAGKI